ncbi:MAG: hypothetical protein Kow00121_23620 [Elainellaceae cyanobacterium]
MPQTYKIACSGYADNTAGSLAGASFLILSELLERGFEIDFYGWKGFNEPQLSKYENFRFIAVPENSQLKVFLETLPKPLKKSFSPLIHQLFIIPSNYRIMGKNILKNHQTEKYKFLLFLGFPAPFKTEELPIISWLQGSTLAEWFYIQKLKDIIISLCGAILYFKLMVFYAIKGSRIKEARKNSNILICGSQWSKQQLISEGVNSESIRVLPYPIDLDLFKFNGISSNKKSGEPKVFLWLGRCDPRKRLDLLLKASELVLRERKDIYIKIFGKLRYAEGYKQLIDKFEFPDHLSYETRIERSAIPALMAECDFLIQPSEGEDFGSSVAEALCAGLPVIVGPTNGTKDFISPSSFVFNSYNAESLKETMLQAVEALEKNKEKLALDARQTAEKNFSIANVVDSLQEIFQEAIALNQLSSSGQLSSSENKR